MLHQLILHYITTYGFDSLGIPYDSNNTYIPAEKVPYEENVTPYNFTIVRTLPRFLGFCNSFLRGFYDN